MAEEQKKTRGRPRSEATRQKIMEATANLIHARGVPGVTIEAVATAAGVGKPTIYRYWSNAHELAMAALMDAVPDTKQAERTDPLEALRALLYGVVATFNDPAGRHVAMVLASADTSSEIAKAFRSHFIQSRRQEAETLIEQAIKAGDMRAETSIELTLDMIFGAVFYRLLMGHAQITHEFMDDLLQTCIPSEA